MVFYGLVVSFPLVIIFLYFYQIIIAKFPTQFIVLGALERFHYYRFQMASFSVLITAITLGPRYFTS